jgi:hypothetical protein
MKIIQIVMKKDEIYGLCDGGQLWRLDSYEEEPSLSYWSLMEIPCFVHHRIDDSFDNEFKINLTKE